MGSRRQADGDEASSIIPKIDKQKRARDGGRVWYTPPQIYVWV